MAFLSIPVNFYRLQAEALDTTEVHSTYHSLTSYATTSPYVYSGQVCSVIDDGAYIINSDKTVKKLGSVVISKTYAELKALRESSSLVAGQYYKITDFQTKWWNQVQTSSPNYAVLTSSVIEPLIVLAVSPNKFSLIAYSELYPEDIIYYDFEETRNRGLLYGTTIPNSTGWITRRIDTSSKNIDIPFDWRHITVNCSRPDISNIAEWSSTTSYDMYDVIKLNNKLYFSVYGDNLNNTPTFASSPVNERWRMFTGFNEGLTYFATNESSIFTAYKPDGSIMLQLNADISTSIQKYMFDGGGAEQISSGSNSLNGVTNIKIDGTAFCNVFLGPPSNIRLKSARFNTIGIGFTNNEADDGFNSNIISDNCSNNKFGINFYQNLTTYSSSFATRTFTGNTFKNDTYKNIFGLGFIKNTLGDSIYNNLFSSAIFDENTIQGIFRNNSLPYYFRRNEVGTSFYNNDLKGSKNIYDNVIQGRFYNITITNEAFFSNVIFPIFRDTTINGIFRQNVIQGSFFNNTLSGTIAFNTIGTQCGYVTINGGFSYNTVAGGFSYCTIGSASYNNIGDSFRNVVVGNNFRYNVVEPYALYNAGDLTSATHVYNTYSKRIFKNSSNVSKLSYYNSSDIQTIVLPTA